MLMYVTVLLLVVVTAMTVFGDYLIKTATGHSSGIFSAFFIIGALFYGLSAIGWFYLMRHHSLTWIAVSYSAGTLVFLALLDVAVFGQTLRGRDMAAVAMALGSLFLIQQG